MVNESVFHSIFIFAYLGVIVIRIVYGRLAAQPPDKIVYKESRSNMKVRGVFNLLYLTVVLSYMIYPRWLAWAGLPLPLWTRWVGAVLALAAIPLTAWVQWALGKNFSSTLHIREGHTLVTRGPYRWVRHPMYTVLFTFSIGILLLTANWVIGVPLAVVLVLVIWSRIDNEEAVLIEQFGEDYREYMRRTGRFLPRIT